MLALRGWGRRAVSGWAGRRERGCAEEARALGWAGGLAQPLSELEGCVAGLLDRDSRHGELGCWCRWVRGQEVTRLGQGPEVAVRLWALWDAQDRAPRAHVGPTAMSLTTGVTLKSGETGPFFLQGLGPQCWESGPLC